MPSSIAFRGLFHPIVAIATLFTESVSVLTHFVYSLYYHLKYILRIMVVQTRSVSVSQRGTHTEYYIVEPSY